MGEAKQRKTFSQRIREDQPYCIFCGGETPSETVEHYPPRSIFDGKHRPKGMEFGACKACNEDHRIATNWHSEPPILRYRPISRERRQRLTPPFLTLVA